MTKEIFVSESIGKRTRWVSIRDGKWRKDRPREYYVSLSGICIELGEQRRREIRFESKKKKQCFSLRSIRFSPILFPTNVCCVSCSFFLFSIGFFLAFGEEASRIAVTTFQLSGACNSTLSETRFHFDPVMERGLATWKVSYRVATTRTHFSRGEIFQTMDPFLTTIVRPNFSRTLEKCLFSQPRTTALESRDNSSRFLGEVSLVHPGSVAFRFIHLTQPFEKYFKGSLFFDDSISGTIRRDSRQNNGTVIG